MDLREFAAATKQHTPGKIVKEVDGFFRFKSTQVEMPRVWNPGEYLYQMDILAAAYGMLVNYAPDQIVISVGPVTKVLNIEGINREKLTGQLLLAKAKVISEYLERMQA